MLRLNLRWIILAAVLLTAGPATAQTSGFWLGGDHPPVACPAHPQAICHPGAGNSIGWADLQTGLAVAICHNRMFNPPTVDADPLLPIARSLKTALGLPI